MVACARNMAAAIRIPIIADADTGYGDLINVRRTVAEYESVGVAGIHLEDEARPSKDAEGTLLVPTDVMAGKIRAAADTRQNQDFLLIARSDALPQTGLAATIERARAYLAAGADALFILKLRERNELEAFPKEFPGVPLVFNMTARGADIGLSASDAAELGYKIIIVPNMTLLGAVKAVTELLKEFRRTGSLTGLRSRLVAAESVDELTGLPVARSLQLQYRVASRLAQPPS
jgi:2,3-dimethylmalate lyase